MNSENRRVLIICSLKSIKAKIVLPGIFRNYKAEYLIITDYISNANKKQKTTNIIKIGSSRLIDYYNEISSFDPHLIIACGWGKLIPAKILDLSKIASVNCHSSYLPDYKGASVFKHYWSNLEFEVGATVHYMTKRFDDGNIITQYSFKRKLLDSPKKILIRQSEITSILLYDAIKLIEIGYMGIPQSGGRYFYKMSNRNHVLWFLKNLLRYILGMYKVLTPHKKIKK